VATPTGQGRDGWLAGWPIDEWAHLFFCSMGFHFIIISGNKTGLGQGGTHQHGYG
jgi:hypothetical protein